MRAVEKYLGTALSHFETHPNGRKFFKNNKAISTYKGYIASFGTMILQSGLLPAVVVFSNTTDNSDESREPVVNAVFELLKSKSGLNRPSNANSLLTWAKDKPNDHALRQEVMNASIALKLAFRTFEFGNDSPQNTSENG